MSFHLQKAHALWQEHLSLGDTVIDATCGNGHDAHFLAHLVGPSGTLICIDIQKAALENTQKRLGPLPQVQYIHGSHVTLPSVNPTLIVYNLGYLPGSDKTLTTQTKSTLESIQNALKTLAKGGLLSITCYPGHPEGARETSAVNELLLSLPSDAYYVQLFRQNDKPHSPKLNTISKLN